MVVSPARLAAFVVTAAGRRAIDVRRVLEPAADRAGTEGDGIAFWEIIEQGSSRADVSQLVGQVLRRVQTVAADLAPLVTPPDVTCLLRVVLYANGADETGPGFAIGTDAVRLLASVGAFIDLDLYAVDAP